MSNTTVFLLTLSPTIEENEDDFVSPWARVLAVSWLAFLAACCYMHQKQESTRQEREERERIADMQRKDREKKLNPKYRINIIANKILQKTIVKNVRRKGSLEILFNQGNEDSDTSYAGTEAEICQDVKITTSSSMTTNDVKNLDLDETEHLTCSVCLDAFEAGDTLSWSKELRCKHVFHGGCLLPWLMKNDDCPMCRTTLIQDLDYDDTKGGDEDERANDVGSIHIVNGLISYVGRVREQAAGFSRLMLSRSKDDYDDGDDMAKVIPLKDDPDTDTDSDNDIDIDIENALCNKEKKSFRSKGERKMSKKKYHAVQTHILQDTAEEC